MKFIYVEPVDRPERKLIVCRAQSATEYWGFCEEVGCDVWDTLNALTGGLDEPIALWLPNAFRPPGTSEYVMALEVPLDYSGPVPDGMELAHLPACEFLRFQGEPYAEESMGQAIGEVQEAIARYRPESHGWRWAEDMPKFQYAPMGERGYIECRPVRRRE